MHFSFIIRTLTDKDVRKYEDKISMEILYINGDIEVIREIQVLALVLVLFRSGICAFFHHSQMCTCKYKYNA
jgi:hypothetical protein